MITAGIIIIFAGIVGYILIERHNRSKLRKLEQELRRKQKEEEDNKIERVEAEIIGIEQ